MSLPDAITHALAQGEKLKALGAANEANTKALLIEPLLSALGWTPSDPNVVEREVKVFEGTFLDYGLKADGAPRLYVEAKGIGGNLTDKKFVAQTVNYANNDGVVWCVLTNGITWRIFKTNETAVMDRKLLFEIDISDETQPVVDMARLLRLISRESVIDGALDDYGERVFTDVRVRAALAALAIDPPAALIDAVSAQLGHPPVHADVLGRSLARIFGAPAGSQDPVPAGATDAGGRVPAGPPQPPQPPKGQEYSLAHHLASKSALMNELFSEVNGFGIALGADVTRRVRKVYIGYFRGKKSFFTVETQKQRILIYLTLDLDKATPWNDHVMRDAGNIGHFGMGNLEYSLASTEQLPEARRLIHLAYENSK